MIAKSHMGIWEFERQIGLYFKEAMLKFVNYYSKALHLRDCYESCSAVVLSFTSFNFLSIFGKLTFWGILCIKNDLHP